MRKAAATNGRIDKRQAILDAAFVVFARRGYGQACVQEIADEAGVAKPTVYNHLNDKETLFRHAVEAVADAIGGQCLEALSPLRATDASLPAALEDSALRLLRIHAGERARSLRSLTYAQLPVFPDLIDTVHDRTSRLLVEALSDRLARHMLAGRLRTVDPALAAEQFLALLTGPLETRTGTRKPTPSQLRALAEAAVDTFLRAYGTDT
ncbi:TetR family transcriptional regulator [Nocardia tenerifensis]|uniref:TetR family transcriptional regulator n=1 Tax=Nocardia tenerifensis TaxID=228006 RepID=A0A318K3C5_9NOCA|nr:TetR/AcrR family transcriptional regulator [Nocardia tenerifensis]PXX56500.1 TetR family transcriptional regulator [Nocardia tenerifensis]